ncbi:MAG: hypothetical protein IKA54_01585 [Clostridia bacterium]|jgi:hypothetical protein|nr:hypothetical protein [Clostridia bacterium]
MTSILILFAIIGVVVLLSKFLPNIIASIPAVIGIIFLAIIIGGVIFFVTLPTI